LPLLVGGSSGFRTDEAIHLIGDFARDESPKKKLDFLSFHHYWVKRPVEVASWEDEIDGALAKASLPTEIPIFVTEIGYAWQRQWRGDPGKNLWQAVGMTAFQYQVRDADNLRLFPWVQYHSEPQIALVQFDTKLRMTPFGAAVKILRMHRRQEIAATSSGLDKNGNGLGALATLDETGLSMQLWNLQPDGKTAVRAEISLSNVPQELRSDRLVVRRYLIDSTHSNCFSPGGGSGGLEMVEERQIDGREDLRLFAELEPMSLCLWTMEKAVGGQR
jgi:hypothetical protein